MSTSIIDLLAVIINSMAYTKITWTKLSGSKAGAVHFFSDTKAFATITKTSAL